MDNKNFVHLHVHSSKSAFDGHPSTKSLVMQAREMGFPAIALTDHGTVGGLIKFMQFCNATKGKDGKEIPFPKIKPLPGIEAYMSSDRRVNRDISSDDENIKKANYHVILIAKNFKGYENLCTLSELSYTEGFYSKPRVDFELLNKYKEGIICTSACLKGLVNMNLLNDRFDAAKRAVGIFKDIYQKDFFLELECHGIAAEIAIIEDVFKLSQETDVPIIAANDVHYLTKQLAKVQEVLMCMSTKKCIKDPKHLSFPYPEMYMKSANEMAAIFGNTPQVLTNTLAIPERVDTDDIIKNLFVSKMRLPSYEVPIEFKSPSEYLEKLAWDGLKRLGWDNSKDHIKALKTEMEDIKVALKNNGLDFPTYFLMEWDVINWAKKNNIFTGCGRGSGFASVALRCLGITYGPDPLKYNLLWERFLGFDNRRFFKESDLGFGETEIESVKSLEEIKEADEDEDDRDLEDDLGGVDRY